ncbi:MAG: hypothetical protein U9Q82_11155 [Chloroflexota bacterium]|nr:hypothetical protein [Chloroflexota bacterium]
MTAKNPYNSPPDEESWSPLDGISTGNWRPEKRDRDRGWEKSNRAYSYRSVAPEIHKAILTLAEDLMVTVDEVAEAFVQYSIFCIERGELQVEAYIKPKARRMTLFPDGEAGWQEVSWDPTSPTNKKKRQNKNEKKQPWKKVTSYRIDKKSHAIIRQLADEHNIPTGEVVTLLFGHSLNAYRSGKLLLKPQPVTVKMTLKGSYK